MAATRMPASAALRWDQASLGSIVGLRVNDERSSVTTLCGQSFGRNSLPT